MVEQVGGLLVGGVLVDGEEPRLRGSLAGLDRGRGGGEEGTAWGSEGGLGGRGGVAADGAAEGGIDGEWQGGRRRAGGVDAAVGGQGAALQEADALVGTAGVDDRGRGSRGRDGVGEGLSLGRRVQRWGSGLGVREDELGDL